MNKVRQEGTYCVLKFNFRTKKKNIYEKENQQTANCWCM